MRLLALLSVVLLAGCGVRPAGLAASLPGSTWLVDRIVGPDGSVRRGTGETVSFGSDGRISLSSCNVCNGPYTLSAAGVLTLGAPLACTRRTCRSGMTELESDVQDPLQVSRDGEYLVLSGAAGETQILLLPETATAPAVAPN